MSSDELKKKVGQGIQSANYQAAVARIMEQGMGYMLGCDHGVYGAEAEG